MKNKSIFICLSVLIYLLTSVVGCRAPVIPEKIQAPQRIPLEEGFKNPPRSAGIRCFWWWLNGNVTADAITSDLEQMKQKGFSGALIVDAGGAEQRGNRQVPAGPMFSSDEWRKLFIHAVKEADRLGLKLSLNIQSGWNLGGPIVTSDMAAKMLTWSQIQIAGPTNFNQKLPMPKTKRGYYKDIVVLAYPVKQSSNLAADKQNRKPIKDLQLKAAFREVGMAAPDCRFLLTDFAPVDGEEDVKLADIIDITEKMDSAGILNWDVPDGRWVVFRFGYTPTDARVSTYSGNWNGLAIDHMDSDILKSYWNQVIQPLLEDIGPLAGKTLKYAHTDSWECGGANWTKNFTADFKKRRGYNPIVYLPVIAGKIVENRDVSNSFLADFRKTISDCIAENHYQVFADLAHKNNLDIHPESGGPHAGPFDAIKCLGRNDMVLSEFWVPSPHRPRPVDRFYVKQASSVAHIYGKKYIAAEAFTSIGPHWEDVLWASQKPSFDHEICSGLNLAFIHTFTCSPKQMKLPGQEYFAGTHFNPNVTWWPQVDAFITYLNRCQFVVQQGNFVADILYYYGDHVPNIAQLKQADPPHALPGYDYDVINEEVLLSDISVKDSCIVLPSGMSYKALVLPNHKVLSLAVLKKVQQLVDKGAVVIGDKPEKAVSLVGFPQSTENFQQIADKLWGTSPEKAGRKNTGKGKIIWGKTAREVLLEENIAPDFEVGKNQNGSVFDYIHYMIGDDDVYFVCNQKDRTEKAVCTFRVQAKQPEIWDPVTGQIRTAGAFSQNEGRTSIPLEFNPYGSMFIVFRKAIPKTEQGSEKTNFSDYKIVQKIDGPWQVAFDPKWAAPEKITFDSLISWTNHPDPNIKYYSGKATYHKVFNFEGDKEAGRHYVLDLGQVGDTGIAQVKLNSKDLGIIWTKPFRADITDTLKAGENTLNIDVVNSWRNRLVGDRNLPENKRFTRTNITIRREWRLLDSGLLGPVAILSDK